MKIDRLLAIIMILLNRNHVSANELSKHFEVSKRTIYRDIDIITQAGIPITSTMGPEGGYSIMKNFKIDKHFLSLDEISSILTALNSIHSTTNNKKISNTLKKLEI